MRKNNKKTNKFKLKSILEFKLPVLYKNTDGDDAVYDVNIKIPQGLSKKKAVGSIKYLFNFYCPTVTFEDLCTQQGWKFLIQWRNNNYEYL